MKAIMKTFLLLIFAGTLLKANLAGQDTKYVKLRIMDENGMPIEKARAVISYVLGREADEHIGLTDREGFFSAQGKPLVGIYMAASKVGYYPASFDSSRSDFLPPGNNIEKIFILPRVIKPTALHALDYEMRSGQQPPLFLAQGKWLGYDLEVGDWIQPYGKGNTVDLQFRFKTSFNGWKFSEKDMANSRRINSDLSEDEIRFYYGRWDGNLELSFPGEKEGLCEEMKHFLAYSKMKLPHLAPLDGYRSKWLYTANTYAPSTARENVGFFLRTRVRLDDKGDIISANYTKVIGDFHFSPANGSIRFRYYFNPIPNDRNLEFDPKRNLFPADFPGADISDP
jgi:hypothetical protein